MSILLLDKSLVLPLLDNVRNSRWLALAVMLYVILHNRQKGYSSKCDLYFTLIKQETKYENDHHPIFFTPQNRIRRQSGTFYFRYLSDNSLVFTILTVWFSFRLKYFKLLRNNFKPKSFLFI